MILEVPFLLSQPAKWNDKWTPKADYSELSKYRCEGVFIEALMMRASRPSESVIAITFKTKLRNRGGHDKHVYLAFELQTDGKQIAEVDLPKSSTEESFEKARGGMFAPTDGGIKVEESDSATKLTKLGFPAAEIGANTKMKVTMSLRNE